MQKTRLEVIKTVAAHAVNFRSAQWGDIKPFVEVLRVDALAYAENPTKMGSSVSIVVDRVVDDTAYCLTVEDVPREVLFTRRSVEQYPSLEGGDNYLYFVPRKMRP